MAESYLTRFVKVIEKEGGRFAGHDPKGRLLLAEYLDEHFDPPIVLDFDEDEFLATMELIGNRSQGIWDEETPAERGFRLALVHLYESVVMVKHPVRRMYFDNGQLRLT
jgi:hypothetical protein